MKLFAGIAGSEIEFELTREGVDLVASSGSRVHKITTDNSNGIIKSITVDGVPLKCAVFQSEGTYYVTINGTTFQVKIDDLRSEQIKTAKKFTATAGEQMIRAPIPGIIKKIFVNTGDHVKKGTPVCTLVAMKMENEITSHIDGLVKEIFVTENATIDKDKPIAAIDTK